MNSEDNGSAAPKSPEQLSTMTLTFDPEYWEAVKSNALTGLQKPRITTAQQMRELVHPFMKSAIEKGSPISPSSQVSETKIEIKSFDNATIAVWRFAKPEHRAPLGEAEALRPAVLNIHGGGMICCDVAMYRPVLRHYVDLWGIQVFAVDYRLAPESPAPGPVEDSYAALKWLSENAKSMGVDPARLVLFGDSAGGGIAAGTAILARDRNLSPPLAKQVLIYPMLDDRTIGRYGPDWPIREMLVFDEAANQLGWECYVGVDKAGKADADVSIFAAPGRANVEDLVGLPRTYIDAAGLDLLRDEDLAYAQKLLHANVEVEFHLYPGVPHGFESSVTPNVVARASENRRRAIQTV